MRASATRGTFRVDVSAIGDSISPSSSICVDPISFPNPLPTKTAPGTFSRKRLPAWGKITVTPVRTFSPRITVVCPTRTPATSVIALSGPVGRIPGVMPMSRARGRPGVTAARMASVRNRACMDAMLYSRPQPHRMLVFTDPLRQTDLPRGCVATIGNFDGMHIGHQQIVRGVVEQAAATGRPSAVITFNPHPLSIVPPDRVPKQILTLPQKEELLREMGVDALLVVPFSHEFSRWTATRFIEEFLVNALRVVEVRIGRDFAFGAGREGHQIGRASCRERV